MTRAAAALLDQAATAGVTLHLAAPDKIKLRGDPEAIAVWAPRLRPHRAELLRLLSEARPTWLITERDGTAWTSTFAPAITFNEVLELYAGATVAPVPDPDIGAPLPADVVATISGWLDRLGEDCPDTRREVLQRARDVPAARADYLQRANRPAPPGSTGTGRRRPNHDRPTLALSDPSPAEP